MQTILDQRRWKYCFIGGVAVQHWGQPRFTKDVDLTILTGFGVEEKFIDELLKHFPSRVPDARKFAVRSRVLLLTTPEKIDIDVSLGAFWFEQNAVQRARKITVFDGVRLRLCTAEDLIVYKAFANRPIDWMGYRRNPRQAIQTHAGLGIHYHPAYPARTVEGGTGDCH